MKPRCCFRQTRIADVGKCASMQSGPCGRGLSLDAVGVGGIIYNFLKRKGIPRLHGTPCTTYTTLHVLAAGSVLVRFKTNLIRHKS